MTRDEWALALCQFGEWIPTLERRIGITAWASKEDSGALANPLDTEEGAPGSTLYNRQGVRNYPSTQVGLEATYATLQNGYYPDILANLATEGASALSLSAVVTDSPWGTGNFSRYIEEIKAGDPYGYMTTEVAGTGAPPVPDPGDDVFASLAQSPRDDFNATVRYLYWITHENKELSADDQNYLWTWYQTPEADGGAGGSIDLVLSKIPTME